MVLSFFKKQDLSKGTSVYPDKKSAFSGWYKSRYDYISIQRNFLLLVTILSLSVVAVQSYTVYRISVSRTLEPFVVEIEKRTGIATLVDPLTVKEYSANEALSNFFILEYIRAREVYEPNNVEFNYYTKVRLFSTEQVYREFTRSLSTSNPNSPVNLYANVRYGRVKVRSIQNLGKGKVQVRFTVEYEYPNGDRVTEYKITTLSFEYSTINMNAQEREVNPLGFQIYYYKVDKEFL